MSSTDLVRNPIAIPPALATAGVKVVETNGVRAVTIPRELEATHNIVRPVSEIAQADPDWSPRLVEVYISPELDPPKGNARASYSGKHVYVQDKMLALNKQAIMLLADAAGISVRTWRTPQSEIGETEIGYDAIAYVRRSDGSLAEWPGSRTVDKVVERSKVEESCRNRDTGVVDRDYFVKRWATELDHLRAKCESKAMLRAVSGAMQLKRGGYTPEELRKPFLIVGWSMTPQDPEVRRARLLGAEHALYGSRARAIAAPAEPEVERPVRAEDPEEEHVDPADVEVDDTVPTAEPDPAPVAGEVSDAMLAAGEVVIPEGFRATGLKVGAVAKTYLEHLADPGRGFDQQHPELVAAARLYLQHPKHAVAS